MPSKTDAMLCRRTILLLLLPVLCAGLCRCAAAKSSTRPISFDHDIKPLLSRYCYGCHGDAKKKADLSLEAFQTESEALKEHSTWEKVLHNVQTREMPPENKPQPSEAERQRIARWIETKVFECDCSKPDPGRVTIRRLNRNEYNNTIRDLFGIDFHPADDFPADDTGYGFDNIGDVLSLSPVLFEKYMAAAEKILDRAIVTHPNTNGPPIRIEAGEMDAEGPSNPTRNGAVRMTKEARLVTDFNFLKEGDYVIRVLAYGEQAGDELPKMRLRLSGKELTVFDVAAREDEPKVYEYRLHTAPGKKQIAVSYINNYFNPKEPDPEKRDRNLIVMWLEVVGPAGPQEYPESHKRIFGPLKVGQASTHRPLPAPPSRREGGRHEWGEDRGEGLLKEGEDRNARPPLNDAREIISTFAGRAFRRPPNREEINRLLSLYKMAREDGENFEGGIKIALEAILVSPHFLFRGEAQPAPDNPNKISPVDEFALASRLSYFLWSTMPDDELFALAEKKKLRKNQSLQLQRMLRDPKAEAFVENFVGQWLQLRNLKLVQPDTTEFPSFDEELRAAMQKETELLFANVMKEDRLILELVDADYTFANERLAKHYGIEGVKGSAFRKIKLNHTDRGGVLTHASILTLTSNPTRTSPVKRGKWVLENILGTPPPPPPPNVPDLKEGKHEAVKGTLRQRMEQHRADPNCANCHARMDPIGFGLENFDGIGAWRKADGDLPIDPSGTLVTGENFKGAAELKKILAEKKKNEFARCLTEKMLTYALGRGLTYRDKCALDDICKDLARHDYKFSVLVRGIVNSLPFQFQRGESIKHSATPILTSPPNG